MSDLIRAWLLQPVLNFLHHLEKVIIMNQAELAQALADATTQAAKAHAEIVAKVAALEAAIMAAGNTTPAVDAALAALKGEVQSLDDLNADAPQA